MLRGRSPRGNDLPAGVSDQPVGKRTAVFFACFSGFCCAKRGDCAHKMVAANNAADKYFFITQSSLNLRNGSGQKSINVSMTGATAVFFAAKSALIYASDY